MPTRWVGCPVEEVEVLDAFGVSLGIVRRPTWRNAVDPGKPVRPVYDPDTDTTFDVPGKYSGSHVIDLAVKPWGLSIVKGVDLSGLDSVPGIVDVFEEDYVDDGTFLANTFRDLGWNPGNLNSMKNRLKQEVPGIMDITLDDPLWLALEKVGVVINPDYPGPHGTWVSNPPGD